MQKGVSLKDIAKKAGVSTALVSYVLNNKRENRTSKETAEKIRDAARQLNYKINQVAKSLKTNKTYTLGLIVADISNPFSASLARIIENESEKYHYTTIFGSSDENLDQFEKLVDTMTNRKVDGLILSPPAGSENIITRLQEQRIPFVLLDRYFPSIKTNYILLDNYAASFDAVQYFIDSGRKNIGMINYDSDLVHLQERKNGYTAALKKNKIAFDKRWLKGVSILNDKPAIEQAFKELLALTPSIDAILFGSNIIAMCCLKYLNTTSIKVPRDLSIISFDQSEMLDVFYAPVTYIKQPLEEIGASAIAALLECIKDSNHLTEKKLSATLIKQRSA
jgi:LacI family transcriptional regulator